MSVDRLRASAQCLGVEHESTPSDDYGEKSAREDEYDDVDRTDDETVDGGRRRGEHGAEEGGEVARVETERDEDDCWEVHRVGEKRKAFVT